MPAVLGLFSNSWLFKRRNVSEARRQSPSSYCMIASTYSVCRISDSNQSGDCAAVSTQHVCLNDNYNQALVSPSRHKEETEIHTHRHSLGIIIRNNFSSNIDNQSQRRSATHTAEERCLLPNDEISHLYNVQLAEVMAAIHRKSYRPAK